MFWMIPGRTSVITEDEIRALQVLAGCSGKEQTIFFVDACHTVKWRWWWVGPVQTLKIAMVNGGETCRIFISST
ncbi:hypothetical protein ACVXHB_00200 [Escherichia coli]